MKKTLPPVLFLLSFIAVIFVGMSKSISAEVILLRSILAGIFFIIVGAVLGYIGSSIVTEHFEEKRKKEIEKK